MGEIANEDKFFAMSSLKPAELRASKRGLLLTTRAEPLGEIIVTESQGQRLAIYPRLERPFTYYPVDVDRPDKAGILFEEPVLEVDRTSMFDPSMGEQLGDLIAGSEGIAVVAHHPDQFSRGDSERIALWPGCEPTTLEIGFRRWRMVVVEDDGQRRVIFSQPA